MLRTILLAGLMLFTAGFAASREGAPPPDMDFYIQEVTVEFATESAAAKAKPEILPLYRGFEWAISSRWDDNIRTDIRMSDVLLKHGYRGTFWLNASGAKSYYGPDYGLLARVGGEEGIGRALIRAGHSVAGHTLEHHWMEALSRAKMWHEVMGIRVDREADLDAPLSLFGVGYGFSESVFDAEAFFSDLEEMQRRSGMYARSHWGLPCDGADIDDAFAARLKDEDGRKEDPIVTFCGHVWYTTPEAWKKFEGQLAKYGNNPRWWYCNYNEYRAYRHQYLNSTVDCARYGRRIKITIRRPDCIDLGDDVPVTFAVTGVDRGRVKGVHCASARVKSIVLADDGYGFNLHHDGDRRLPKKIDAVEDGGGISGEFPFLTAAIERKGTHLLLDLNNNGDRALENLRIVYRLPLAWQNGVVVKRLDRLGPGQFYREDIVLTPAHADYAYMNGKGYYVAQVDFVRAREAGRLYVTCFDNVEMEDDSLPANGFWVLGPLPESRREALKIAKVASEQRPQERTGAAGWRRIEKSRTAPIHPEFVYTTGSDRTEIGEYHFLLLTSIRSAKKRELKYVSYPQAVRAAYLNGKALGGDALPLKRGGNELLLLFNPGSDGISPLHYGMPFRIVDPATGKRAAGIAYSPDDVKFAGVAKTLGAEESARKGLSRKLFDDFEDGNPKNLAGETGIAGTNGDWHVSCDEYGESKISADIGKDESNRSERALHVTGHMGKSVPPKWVHAACASNLDAGGQERVADLTGSAGIAFRARSDAGNVLQLSVEAVVAGRSLLSTGRTHRVTVPLTREWRAWTFHWDEFSQPSYACPGDDCVGPLAVDKVGAFAWNPSEQDKEIDFWLDDVELIYTKR